MIVDITKNLDLERYPLNRPGSSSTNALITSGRSELRTQGVFLLPGFLRASALKKCVDELAPIIEQGSFLHNREHNIYFDDEYSGIPAEHPALTRMQTVSQTVCADQIPQSMLATLYAWPPLIDFIASVVGKAHLYPMDDPLASLNIKSFRKGDVTNWHFDRAEFTITLLLQKSESGGEFQIRRNLRSESEPNHDGVAKLLQGQDENVRTFDIEPGTLTIFRGKNTAHRVSPVMGNRLRIVAVLSYFDAPGVRFADADRIQFYGRSQPQELSNQ